MSTSADERRLVQSLPAVLSADEVMELLGLSPPTLRRLVKDGHLRAHRLPGGRKWVFRADEVLESVGSWPAEEDDDLGDHTPPRQAAQVDPLGLSCSAPPRVSDERRWREACAEAWCAEAENAGLTPHLTSPTSVEVAGHAYLLRVGPRERVLVIDDEGDESWQEIDAVWIEE